MNEIINKERWLPSYFHQQKHIYILLTSLNLGGAEKIVSDQLWANHYSRSPAKVSLLVIYDKHKEHALPPSVNVIRLNNNIKHGEYLFKQMAFEKTPLVCHLIDDKIANYLFDFGLHLHFVIHNDKRGWSTSINTLNHPQTISVTAVAKFVTNQLKQEGVTKPIYTFRHQISPRKFAFNKEIRQDMREQLHIQDDEIVIGMIGRISQQKNYFLALDVLHVLVQKNPKYKMIILGGIESKFFPLYMHLLQKINALKLHNNIIIPGFKENAHQWLNIFDIGLNTSYFEGLSMATQEFMRNGLPMVLSRVCGQGEITDNLKQLSFFELPEVLNNPKTNFWHFGMQAHEQEQEEYLQYEQLVLDIAQKIENHVQPRFKIEQDDLDKLNFLCYASHNLWTLLNYIQPENIEKKTGKTAFLTSNLNLGGAQRSLTNLLIEYKKQDKDYPLILLNQSNQTQFFNELLEHKIDYYLCHESLDVYDICANLFAYLQDNQIETLLFWNVDIKIQLILSKFFSHRIRLVDVSPGDYVLDIMSAEKLYSEAIYYDAEEYFQGLSDFVSKYDNRRYTQNYTQWLKHLHFIPNGVEVPQHLTQKKDTNTFKVLVCGRITPSKHLDTIFEAWRQFVALYPDNILQLDVVGSVDEAWMNYYEKLLHDFQDLLGKSIHLLGHHPCPKNIMPEYHLIVVLGTHQGSPNVVLEAAATHLPVISNDSGGTREVISDNTGILLPETPAVEPLLRALINVYENYDLTWEKAQNCHQHILSNFSMQRMAERYSHVIEGKK